MFSLARSALDRVRDVAAPLTDNVLTRTVASAPGAVLEATRNVVSPVAGAVAGLPSTAVAAPKFMFHAVRNTTTAIGAGIKGTAGALNPFGFFHKLTRGAVVGIGVAVGLIVFIILLCCLVTLWRCVRRNDKRESQGLLYQIPFRKGDSVPYYTMYQVQELKK
uniref:Uncharacterized protein n=1 Tax=Rhipicephalus zambeziensis TaxID=60191 RepID=A0A224YKJ6_9ACAR